MRKTAIVTGAGRGIGKAIALALSKEYNVVVNYFGSEAKAAEVVEACIANGSDAMSIKANVCDYQDVETMVSTILEKYGSIDIVVNNSGITRDNLLLRMNEEDFTAVVDTNLKGCFNVIKHVSRTMMKQRSGVIINMASVIGEVGNVGQSNYAASKAGVIGLTKSIAKELAPRGIRVNAIAPGFIATEMTEVLSDGAKDAIMTNIPMKSFGSVEDVANLALFLASENSKYITGQVINVDGGMVM